MLTLNKDFGTTEVTENRGGKGRKMKEEKKELGCGIGIGKEFPRLGG